MKTGCSLWLVELLLLVGLSNCGPKEEFFISKLVQESCYKPNTEYRTLAKSCGAEYTGEDSFMQIVEQTLMHECDLVDPFHNLDLQLRSLPTDEMEVDFIVVGAGTAGSVVAGRLASSKEIWEVALLEAGGPYPTAAMVPGTYFNYVKPNSPINWNFALEPEKTSCLGRKNGICHIPRGKVLGGTGVLHGMMYMRGNPYDYDKWAESGCEGWSFHEVLPYFKMSERNIQIGKTYSEEYHGMDGPATVSQFKDHPEFAERILAAAEELGYRAGEDLNGESQLGFTFAQATTFNGSRLSSYNSYIVPLIGKHNLNISPYSHVTKILTKGKRAVGVEYMKFHRKYRIYARKEVIISAGAIQSPQILLLSGIGPEKHLSKLNIPVVQNLPKVGENLQNHVSFSIRFKVKGKFETPLNDHSLYEYLNDRTGPMTSTGLSQTTGFVRVNDLDGTPENVPQIQIFFEGFLASCSLNDGEEKLHHVYFTPALLRPKSLGRITLRSSNPLDPPLIKANYLNNEEDVQTLIDGIKLAIKLSETTVMKDAIEIAVPPTSHCNATFGTDDYWRCAVRYWTNPENHQCGTCRMGKTPENSVVDTELKVHGMKGLRVVDASVMPSVISGNVNAPIMMIAEKAADLIHKDWEAS